MINSTELFQCLNNIGQVNHNDEPDLAIVLYVEFYDYVSKKQLISSFDYISGDWHYAIGGVGPNPDSITLNDMLETEPLRVRKFTVEYIVL